MNSVSIASPPPHTPGSLPTSVQGGKEWIQNLYGQCQQLKAKGIRPGDPEYDEYVNMTNVLKQYQQGAQQKAQAAAPNFQNGSDHQINGIRMAYPHDGPQANTASSVTGPSSPKHRTSNASMLNSSPHGGSISGQGAVQGPSQSFSGEQLSVLRNQILAFKYITRSRPIPAPVQVQLTYPSRGQRNSLIGPSLETTRAGRIDGEEGPQKGKGYETFKSPWDKLQPELSYREHGLRDKRLIIPSIMPPGLDASKLHEERERVMYNKIMERKSELEDMPGNLSDFDASNKLNVVGDTLKLKTLIEYKALCLLQKQRALRSQVLSDIVHADNVAVTSNRSRFRRMKKQSLREARITEKLEKQQRDQREQRLKRKQVDYINGIISHGVEIKSGARAKTDKAQRFGRLMLQHHQHMEKEEQKRMERTAKQRLQALKANDEEAYLKLLDQAKDTRITHLLRQTDSFLGSLAASVRQQQRNAVQAYGRPEGHTQEPESEDEEEDNEKVDYYAVAHKIQETISEQPSILTGGKLKDYQIKGLQWMISLYNNNLNGILADEMGLGKTIQTISLITYLIEKKKQNGPFLVIVPLSTLTNWTMEFEKWAPSVGKIVYKGPPAVRKNQQNTIKYSNWQVLLTTYEYIIKDRPVLSKVRWAYMIIDEGHRMKNAQSKLSATLTTYYNCRYRLILTGTPLQNNLPELWALLNFVLPTIFKSVKSFDEWFNTPFANTGGQDKMELTEEEALLVIRRLHKVLRPFLLRRLKKDVESELPDKVEKVVKCKFSALQQKLYAQMMNNGMLYVSDAEKGGKLGVKGLSNMIMQLRKLCNHPFVFEEVENAINPSRINNDSLWRTAGKFELLDRLLPKFFATNHKVLIFFQMTQIMNIMEDFLHLRGFKYLRLDGSTKADDRSDLLKQFNAPESPYFIFLLSTRAGGLGLNLQAADTVVIYDSDWNPHQDLQAQDRAHRIGQKNEVRILRLITSNSVEERILERAQYKLDIDGKVIQAGKFDNKSTNEEREALLRGMLEAEEKEQGDNEELDDEEMNEIIARNDGELGIFRALDQERADDPVYGTSGSTGRLFAESELPDIYLQEHVMPVEEPSGPVGRGARERKVTSYDDGLTEEQWLDAIDNDDDTIEDAVKRKRDKVERRQTSKLKRGFGDTESPAPDDTASLDESPAPGKGRKRGRRPAAEKRSRLEEAEELKSRKRQRVIKGGYVTSDSHMSSTRASLQNSCDAIYEAVRIVEDPDLGGRLRSELFQKLPSKKNFPDYYHIIKAPISFNEIKKRIRNGDYTDLEAFRADFKLMFDNARTYNEESSIVYQDAVVMDTEFDLRFAEEKANFEAQASEPRDGASTAPVSSTATPPGNTPFIKLKVKDDEESGDGED